MDAGNNGYEMYLHSSDNLRFRVGSGADRVIVQTLGVTLRDGVFHHVVATYDGTTTDSSGVTIYVDGVAAPITVLVEDAIGDTANDIPLTLSNQRPGRTFFLTGQMDDVRVFGFALDSDQVDNLFNTSTELQAMLEISGLDLTTPNTTLTSGKTEARLTLDFDVTHSIPGSSLNPDDNAQVDLVSANFGIQIRVF